MTATLRGTPERDGFAASFGDEVALDRPGGRPRNAISPGHHPTPFGRVAVWDARALDVDPPAAPGVRAQDLIVPTTSEIVEADRSKQRAFWGAREATIKARSAPRHRVRTATQISHTEDGAPPPEVPATRPVTRAYVPRAEGRPRGVEFGILVHQTLATIELTASPEGIMDVVRLAARLLPVGPTEIEAAAEAVRRTTASPLWGAFMAADERGELRREVPLEAVLEDGEILEGVVDVAYLEDGEWTVVDYKTDLPAPGSPRLAGYETQVRLYADVLERATGQRANATLLFV
ncbi:MAG: PD-(D/E)XK nuclease family protein [Polyangiaceae bacterium]